MPLRKLVALTTIILFCTLASAKDKKKALLPADVLNAKTVLVIVDPSAGVDIEDPNANRLARVDVEQALDKWGRFRLVPDGYTADLVIMVRKGNGKMVQPTIGGTPINGIPPVSVGSTPTSTRAGGGLGNPGIPNDPSSTGNQPGIPHPQVEAGPSQDIFAVYRGTGETMDPNSSPLDHPAVWRYSAKDALASPSVPAVEAFRKLVVESEKQLASHP